jgi:hypothetical protein
MKGTIAKYLYLIFISIFIIHPVGVYAQTSNQIIWEYLKPNNIAGTGDILTNLEKEVIKVIQSGHLAPFRALYGEGLNDDSIGQYYWYRRHDTVYTLALAYPYTSGPTQQQIATYLKNEMQIYPLWNESYLPVNTGTLRNPDIMSLSQRNDYPGYDNRPKMFAMYVLWLYANNTGDWNYINSNWTNITSFYSRNRGEVSKHYTSIAGAIGYLRMAQQKGTIDSSAVNTATSDINAGLTNGKNFNQFGINAEQAYQYRSGERWDYTRKTYLGFQFIDITPEIGRYIMSDPTLKSAVLGTTNAGEYSIATGLRKFQFWYMAQSPIDNIYFGEGSALAPDTRAMIFPILAWVAKEPISKLRAYVDVPDSLLGDYYYMQNLARSIEAHGNECWENIQTTTAECQGSTFVTVTITPSSTITQIQGDANNDGKVDGIDYVVWLNNYDTNQTGPSKGDFNNDTKVDGIDYIIWLNNYGK